MSNRSEFISFGKYGFHKGFYNDDNVEEKLNSLAYNDYFEEPLAEESPNSHGIFFLRGSCHIFALSLKKAFRYNAYIIETVQGDGFHAFCQIYKRGKIYYIDARGMTTSFDEFMEVAKEFVTDEYIIRQIEQSDIDYWMKDDDYAEEAFDFAEKIIEEFKECYTF